MEDKFIARYEKDGIKKSVIFSRAEFTKKSASKWLAKNDIKNFLFFFEPNPPTPFKENGMMFKGDIGFDITTENLLPFIEQGKEIYLDTFGGDLWEGLKIYDAIKALNINPHIEALGTVASSGIQILIATENRHMSQNSRLLIHNPWTVAMGDDSELRRTANELESEKINLAKLYANVTGKSVDEMLAIMKDERFMFLEEAKELNFVKAKTNNEEIVINNNEDEEMENKEVIEKIGLIENMFNKVMKVLSPPKNIMIQDVNGVEIDFPDVESEEQIAIGDMATVDGSAANGEFILASGETYVFENGALMEIREAVEETEDLTSELTAEIEALKLENENLSKNLENKISEIKKVENHVNEIKKEFTDFKNQFSNETAEINVPAVEKQEKKESKFSYKKK